jgi:hypothetical protein
VNLLVPLLVVSYTFRGRQVVTPVKAEADGGKC